MKKIVFCFLLPIMLFSCKKEDQAAIDEAVILQYIADRQVTEPDFKPLPTGTGLYYLTTLEGSGDSPTATSYVTVYYKGTLVNGTIFDQTNASPKSFFVAGVIQGWQEAIPKMKIGEKATIIVPSALGYGTETNGAIPGGSVLIFDIELVSFI